jgi:YidC/Oxa1 family membrane protein insertase
MLDFIINPFITLLALFYQIFGNNIVLAIVVFTIIVRLATSPLLIQQMRSTARMQELQPKIKKLQEKYKNDREKLQQAQLELYREEGINPLGGCLPLLVQMPIILGLYGAIITALGATPYQVIDLSGRLLIPGLDSLVPLDKIWLGMDLTQPPTVNAAITPLALSLPVIVMVTTWLQSKLTIPNTPQTPGDEPNPAASMTRSMTTIMPLMFGFFALSFSVGLSIYFIVSNVVGIVQYTIMGKADWRRLFGLSPKDDPAVNTAKMREDVPSLDKVIAKVENDAKAKQAERELVAESATGRALQAKPGPAQSSKNPRVSANKKKNRKRK